MTYPTKKLGDVIDFKIVKNTTHLPYVGMEDIESGTGRFFGSIEPKKVRSITAYFDADCVLYGKLRPYLNKVFVPDFEGHCTTEFLPLRPDPKSLTREWFALWLRSESVVEEISRQTTGSRMPRADISYLKQMEIPLPPVVEQRRIVDRLEKQFAKIDEAACLRAESEALAEKLLTAALHDIFSAHKWEDVSLKEISEIKTGATPAKSNDAFWDGDIPWVSPKDMKSWIIDDAIDHISSAAIKQSATNLVPKGTILVVVRSGILKHTLPVSIVSKEVAFNQDIKAISLDMKRALPEFVAYFLKGSERTILKHGIKQGVTVQSFEGKYLENLKIPLPPLVEQRKIVLKLEALAAKTRTLQSLQARQSAVLKSLKQSILHEAFEGK